MIRVHLLKKKGLIKTIVKRFTGGKFLIPLSLLVIFFLLVTIGLSFGKRRQATPGDKIIKRVQEFDEVSQFRNLPAQVTYLDKKEIEERAEKFPVIYQDLSGDIYEVRFSSGDSGILLLYDAKGDKILRTFN